MNNNNSKKFRDSIILYLGLVNLGFGLANFIFKYSTVGTAYTSIFVGVMLLSSYTLRVWIEKKGKKTDKSED